MDTTLTKDKSSQGKNTKQNASHNTILREPRMKKSKVKQKRRQESVNRVEIKFGEIFEKENSKPASSDYSSQKKTTKKINERKQSPKLYSCKNAGPKSNPKLSLAQSIAKAKEKRSHYYTSSKVAWSNENEKADVKPYISHDASDQSTLFVKVPRRRGDPIQSSTDGRAQEWNTKTSHSIRENRNTGQTNADVRFNTILEKLRQTTAELGSNL